MQTVAYALQPTVGISWVSAKHQPDSIEITDDNGGRPQLYVEGFIEGYLGRISGLDPEEEQLFRDLWDDETQQEVVIESLKAYSVR